MTYPTKTFVLVSAVLALATVSTSAVLSGETNTRELRYGIWEQPGWTSETSAAQNKRPFLSRLAWSSRESVARGGDGGASGGSALDDAGDLGNGGSRVRGVSGSGQAYGETSECFPRDATVELENGAIVRMDALQIGDRVLVHVHPETMHKSFSPGHMFTHRNPTDTSSYVAIRTSTNHSLVVTPGHFIYASSSNSGRPNLVAAKDVSVGDLLFVWNESTGTTMSAKVTGLETVVGSDGRYNPQTVHGDIYVDGVRSSTYTTAIAPSVAHRALAPARWVYGMFGVDVSMGLLEGGMPSVSS